MATAGELTIILSARDEVSGHLRGLNQDLARLDKQVESTGGGLSRLGQIGLAGAGIGVIAGGLTAAVGAVGGLVSEASDLNEQLSKTGTVFGDASREVVDFAKTTSAALGISRTQALEAAGALGTLFTASGLGQDAAAGMSTKMVKLAADLASFNNLDPSDTLNKLRSGLVGEAEPLRAVGILLSEDAVKAKAMELGLAGAKGELTEAAKVQARFALIMEQSKTAQGDFTRTSEGLANAQRIIKASFSDLRAELGEQFLPVVARAASWFAQQLPRAMATLREALQALAPILQSVLAGDLGGALDQMMTLLGQLADRLRPILAQWGQAFLDWVAAVTPPLLRQLGELAGRVWAWIEEQAPIFVERLTGEWGPAFLEWVAPLIPPLVRELGKLLVAIVNWALTDGLPALARLGVALGDAMVKGMVRALERIGPAIGESLDEAFANNPLIANAIAAGLGPAGTLLTPGARASVAGAGPALGAAGQAASRAGEGVTVDINGLEINVGMDPQDAARQVGDAVARRVLDALLRSGMTTDPGASPTLAGAGR